MKQGRVPAWKIKLGIAPCLPALMSKRVSCLRDDECGVKMSACLENKRRG